MCVYGAVSEILLVALDAAHRIGLVRWMEISNTSRDLVGISRIGAKQRADGARGRYRGLGSPLVSETR